MRTLQHFLFKKIDNAQLIVFRVFYGILISCEAFGAIATGWVRRVFIEPQFTFSFIGFEWLQPLPGNGMYYYFVLMGLFGILVTLGLRYRFSALAFALMWTGVYLMQKTSYNNHYYLLMLLSYIMVLFPANRNLSLDAHFNPSLKRDWMPNWIRWLIIAQLFIVYTYASIAKLYADWFDFSIIELLMRGKKEYWLIGGLLQEKWIHKIIAVFGIVFDLLVVPALLWKRTRKAAFVCSLFFHLFNSYVFRIGIFPYLSLAFCVFFFDPKTIRNLFLKKKKVTVPSEISLVTYHKPMMAAMIGYLIVQALLPLRHHFIQDDVLWTEEGHRLSWRMMLRTRSGHSQFKVVGSKEADTVNVKLRDYLTNKQRRKVGCYPDYIWQFAQHLKKEYAKKGESIKVFVVNKTKVNAGTFHPLVDPTVDLAAAEWKHLSHNEWILPQEAKSSEPKK